MRRDVEPRNLSEYAHAPGETVMLGLLGLLGLCTRCASLEPMALTSTPCEQFAKPQPSTASCMLVGHGGVMLTKQIGLGWIDSCEDCSRLVSPARQTRTSTPLSDQPNSNSSTGSNPTNFTYCGHYPPLAQHKYSQRRRVHSFMLPCKDDKNFISRVLLKHCSQLI